MPPTFALGLGVALSVGVAAAVYTNKDKIKEVYLAKKRELEHELRLIHDEIQNALDPMQDIHLRSRPSSIRTNSSGSSSAHENPFEDSNVIRRPNNVSESEFEEEEDDDELFHSFVGTTSVENAEGLKRRTTFKTAASSETFDGETKTSDNDQQFFSYVDLDGQSQDMRSGWTPTATESDWDDAEDSSAGFNTPTASEIGDYNMAAQAPKMT